MWSLALRRDSVPTVPEIGALALAPEDGQPVFTTGLVIQELLQGFGGPKGREQILERLSHCL